MALQKLTDDEIIAGFRKGDSSIIKEYFYGYCRVGYMVFNQRYQLSEKENLDFMSLAHQYALYLMEHDWKPLEDHSPNVSLRTWLINGFRFIVLDALKWYKKEYGSITFEDYLCSFDLKSNLRLQFNRMIEDLCENMPMTRDDRFIIEMIILKGYQGKEVADLMGQTPASLSLKYKRIKKDIIYPYFRENFDMELDMEIHKEEVSGAIIRKSTITEGSVDNYSATRYREVPRRSTPENITELSQNEIFVFGSNLKGLHSGGAAYTAYRKFGAIMGQGIGLQGQSYAIPTMQGGVETIRPYVDEFIQFAKEHPNLTFLVTRIGCGIAGFRDGDISPLFKKAHDIENVVLPQGW